MSQNGIGFYLYVMQGGNQNEPDKYYGREIVKADLVESDNSGLSDGGYLRLAFSDGKAIALVDTGQSCCEARYMTCDDDVQSLIGHKLTKIEVKEGPDGEGDEYGGEHEQAFLEITTDDGFITVCTHNEHNGYYGGFGLEIKEVTN